MRSYHKLLLCASHAGASLCVLMCSDQQLNQSGDGALLPQRGVVCRAESQVTDQTNCSLTEEHSYVSFNHDFNVTLRLLISYP